MTRRRRRPTPRHLSLREFQEGARAYLAGRDGGADIGSQGGRGEDSSGRSAYSRGWEWVQVPMIPQLSHLSRTVTIPRPTLTICNFLEEGETTVDDEDLALLTSSSSIDEPPDLSRAPLPPLRDAHAPPELSMTQTIIYSSTWRVPVLYLSLCDSDSATVHGDHGMYGSRGDHGEFPSDLWSALVENTGLVKIYSVALAPLLPHESSNGNNNAGRKAEVHETPRDQRAYFPPLSQADHPINALPCLTLHPCQTASIVGEMLADDDTDPLSSSLDGNADYKRREGEEKEEEDAKRGREFIECFITVCASAVKMDF